MKTIQLFENRIAILKDNGYLYLYNNEFNLEKKIKFKNEKITNIFKLINNKIILFTEKSIKIIEIGDEFLSIFEEFITSIQFKFLLEFKNKKEIETNNKLFKYNKEIVINNNLIISNDNEIIILKYENNKYKKIHTIKCKNISKIQLINEFFLLVSSYKDNVLYAYNLDEEKYPFNTIENFKFNEYNLVLIFPCIKNNYNSEDYLYFNKDGLNLINIKKNEFKIIKNKKINMEEIINIEQKNENEFLLFYKKGKLQIEIIDNIIH